MFIYNASACPLCSADMVPAYENPKSFVQLAELKCPKCGHISTIEKLSSQASEAMSELETNRKNPL